MSWNWQQCLEGLVHKTQAPLIIITSFTTPNFLTAMVTGFHPPPSFAPLGFLSLEGRMSFRERFANAVTGWAFGALSQGISDFDKVSREYFGPETPTAVEIEGNASMIFNHAHFLLTHPRPSLPDTVEVGGMHCRPPKALPKDLATFMDGGAKDGVILFSFGSVVQANELPQAALDIFVKVFSRLKQRVLWKFETEHMDNLPPNVKLSKWLPQQDILGKNP
jgi:glucuronosyltransferase